MNHDAKLVEKAHTPVSGTCSDPREREDIRGASWLQATDDTGDEGATAGVAEGAAARAREEDSAAHDEGKEGYQRG